MHRGLHRTRSAEPIRHENGRYARLIDTLPSDPFVRFLKAAPIDDEPVSAEEETAVAEVAADRAAGVPTVFVRKGQAQLFG